MKKKLVILFLIVLTIVNVAAVVTIAYHRWQFKRHSPPIGRPDAHMNFIKQELGLNEEQAKEFESQAKRFEEEIEPIRDSLEAKRSDLMNEIMAKEPSMDKLNKLSEEIGALHVKLEKRTSMHLLKGKSLLTPEQQKKFFSLFKEGRKRIKGSRDDGREIGGRPRPPNFEEGR
jgi:Spy/CpxP family protein refolding chaperone